MVTIKVSIVDDDRQFVSSLKRFLNRQEDIEVISTTYSKDVAIEDIISNSPDVILMDINLSGNSFDLSGITLTKELLGKNVKSKIIMLTSIRDEASF